MLQMRIVTISCNLKLEWSKTILKQIRTMLMLIIYSSLKGHTRSSYRIQLLIDSQLQQKYFHIIYLCNKSNRPKILFLSVYLCRKTNPFLVISHINILLHLSQRLKLDIQAIPLPIFRNLIKTSKIMPMVLLPRTKSIIKGTPHHPLQLMKECTLGLQVT